MKSTTLEQCLKVMDKLMSKDCFYVFHDPVDPVLNNCSNYFESIQHPMDFKTCQKKLKQGKYRNIKEWKDDIELISSNAIAYNGVESPLGIIGVELRKVFHKYTKNLSESPCSDWVAELNQLCEEFSQNVRPISFQPKNHSFNNVNIGLSDSQNDNISITREEITQIAEEIKMCKKDHVQRLFECLKKNQPQVIGSKKGITVDMCKLDKTTLFALRKELELIKKETIL